MPRKSAPDPFQMAIADRVAEFIAAQQIKSDVSSLKKDVDNKLDKFDARVTAFQKDILSSEANTKLLGEMKKDLSMLKIQTEDLRALQLTLSKVQDAQGETQSNLLQSASNAEDKLQEAHATLTTRYHTLFEDVETTQKQHTLAVQRLGTLKRDIERIQDQVRRVTRANDGFQVLVTEKFSTLEAQLEKVTDALRGMPDDEIAVLASLASRRGSLLKLPGQHVADEDEKPGSTTSTQPTTEVLGDKQKDAFLRPLDSPAIQELHANTGRALAVESLTRKRKLAEVRKEANEPEVKRMRHPALQEFTKLFRKYDAGHHTNPWKNQCQFIWRFIDEIGDEGLHKHVQKVLRLRYPDLVTPITKSKRARNERHDIMISTHLTWEDLCEAMRNSSIPDHLRHYYS